MASDAILLGDVAAQITYVIIACRTCQGRSRLETDQLLRVHGPDTPMSTLLSILASACPRLNHSDVAEQCDVHCPSLAELLVLRPLVKVD
jgi:hypothetical protein